MQKHFTLLFIGADCISSFATTGCSHFVSIKPRKTVTDQIIFYTRAHVYCTSSWHTVCGPMGPTAYKNVDSGRYFWPSAPKRGHVWVTDAVVRGCARDVPGMWRESGREGGRDRERWLTRGPSILRVTVEVHSVRLVSLMCITLAWRVMEGGRLSRGAREWLILHILEEEQERRYPCAWLMA